MSRYTYYYTLGRLLRVYICILLCRTATVVLQLRSAESGAGDSIDNLGRGEEEKNTNQKPIKKTFTYYIIIVYVHSCPRAAVRKQNNTLPGQRRRRWYRSDSHSTESVSVALVISRPDYHPETVFGFYTVRARSSLLPRIICSPTRSVGRRALISSIRRRPNAAQPNFQSLRVYRFLSSSRTNCWRRCWYIKHGSGRMRVLHILLILL